MLFSSLNQINASNHLLLQIHQTYYIMSPHVNKSPSLLRYIQIEDIHFTIIFRLFHFSIVFSLETLLTSSLQYRIFHLFRIYNTRFHDLTTYISYDLSIIPTPLRQYNDSFAMTFTCSHDSHCIKSLVFLQFTYIRDLQIQIKI